MFHIRQATFRSAILLAAVWAGLPGASYAGGVKAGSAKPGAKSPALVAEGLQSRSIRIRKEVEKNKVDGLVIGVHQVDSLNDQNPRLVSPSDVFKEGDRIRVSLESNFEGYIYLVNIAPDGNKYLSFPSREAQDNNNRVTPGNTLWMPPQDPLIFDGTKGIETLRVIVSKNPIGFYEEGYKTWKEGKIPETEKESGKGNTRGIVTREKVLIPAPMKGKILARKIDLAPPDKTTKEAVIAIPKDKVSDGKMNDQPVVFEIRLQHN